MGIHVIKMPDIGEGIAEVELAEWRVKVGDVVVEDQALVDVMTDKATVEIPSPVAGKVLALSGVAGQVLAVGSEVIRIEVEGAGNLKDAAATQSAAPVVAAPVATAVKSAERTAPSAPARPVASAATTAPRVTAPLTPAPSAQRPEDRPIASPSVRRRAWELGVDLQSVAGSGPGGRITQADLDASTTHAAHAAPGARAPYVPSSSSAPLGYAERHDELDIPVIGLRRRIAQKMQESKRRIPHFTYVEEVDVGELELLRARLNATWANKRGKLTMLPFLMRAVVLAVREFPQMNARYNDEANVVTQYGAVHLGVAVQTDVGLMVPVVQHAEARDMWSSAAEVARLAEVARTGKVTRGELTGSTITITSLGALGGIVSTPVINYPEVGIIAINRVVERPVIRNGAVVARQMMNLSSSFDHRVVDGQYAAQFVQAMRGLLECPAMLFVDG